MLAKLRAATPVEMQRPGDGFEHLVGQVRDLLATVQELESVLGELGSRPAERPAPGRAARIYDLRKVLAPED